MNVRDQIIEAIDRLTPVQQECVLDYLNSKLGLPKGAGPESWRKFIGCIDKQSADEMMQAIEEDCERIDFDTW